jgi:hypothetical protein
MQEYFLPFFIFVRFKVIPPQHIPDPIHPFTTPRAVDAARLQAERRIGKANARLAPAFRGEGHLLQLSFKLEQCLKVVAVF